MFKCDSERGVFKELFFLEKMHQFQLIARTSTGRPEPNFALW